MGGPSVLTPELVSRVVRAGGSWLAELAEQGLLRGELVPLRRIAWAYLFGIITGETAEGWAEALERQRKQYTDLVEDYKRQTNVKNVDPNKCNPLARTPDNPFTQMHANDELLKEIWKDVERTFSEVELLSSSESRKVLQRILFHWCRAVNPAKAACDSYRQGMNELAAVALAAAKGGEYGEESWESTEALGQRLCGRQHTEADAFLLFSKLMDMGLRPMFMPSSNAASPAARNGGGARRSPIGDLPPPRAVAGDPSQVPSSAILARCMFIYDTLVKNTDAGLHAHLKRLDIEPQVFLLRWIRLLFSREYSLEETLHLWDGLFYDAHRPPGMADSPGGAAAMKYPECSPNGGGEAYWREAAEAAAKLPLLDFMSAAFLRSMRGELLGLDQTECLRRLLAPRPAVSTDALLNAARKLRDSAAQTPSPTSTPSAAESSSPSPGGQGFGAGTTGGARGPSQPAMTSPPQAGGMPAAGPYGGGVPGGPGGAAGQARGQHLLSAAAQGAQGFLSAATQAVASASQKLSESLPAGDLGGGTYMEQLQRRVVLAEQERDTIKKKANEFVVAKKAEWAAKVGALETQVAERDARIADLEARLAEAEARLGAGSLHHGEYPVETVAPAAALPLLEEADPSASASPEGVPTDAVGEAIPPPGAESAESMELNGPTD